MEEVLLLMMMMLIKLMMVVLMMRTMGQMMRMPTSMSFAFTRRIHNILVIVTIIIIDSDITIGITVVITAVLIAMAVFGLEGTDDGFCLGITALNEPTFPSKHIITFPREFDIPCVSLPCVCSYACPVSTTASPPSPVPLLHNQHSLVHTLLLPLPLLLPPTLFPLLLIQSSELKVEDIKFGSFFWHY